MLYVPDVPESACPNSTISMIPSNVTRIDDLPDSRLGPIAIAPWTSADCVQAYLSAMRAEAVNCAIFYRPDSGGGEPPAVNDAVWDLSDGGRWQNENQYPIYALPGTVGTFLLQQLALYSGNMTSAPNGESIALDFDDHDFVRLVAQIDVSGSSGIPSLWVFLIIVLAILLAIVLTTSVVMHLIQRRQRRRLAQRVARGEVDLEALGIKRLNVPQDLLDKMPTYTYTSKEGNIADAEAALASPTPSAPIRDVPYSQSTCPICLDDFVHASTQVRELPCNHIFHPECIDPFLKENSSLCPMCKKSALPAGYCPVTVTNIMVRRERLVRRMRARASGEERLVRAIDAEGGHGVLQYHIHRLRDRMAGRQAFSAGLHRSARGVEAANGTEMQQQPAAEPAAPETIAVTGANAGPEAVRGRQLTEAELEEVPAEVQAQGTSARRAWLRDRFARREERRYQEGTARVAREVDENRPACEFPNPSISQALQLMRTTGRRGVGRVFPGLA